MQSTDELVTPAVITNDADNATVIRPSEAPPDKKEKFRRLRLWQNGAWNGPKREVKDVARRRDDLHRYDAISSKLSLTDFQQKRGRELLDDLDLDSLTSPDVDVDSVIFAICVLTANDDVDRGTRYYPPHVTDEEFAQIADDLGLSVKEQLSAIERVRHGTRYRTR